MGSGGTLVIFQPRGQREALRSALERPAVRDADDARTYPFATAILRGGYRLTIEHIRLVSRMNAAGSRSAPTTTMLPARRLVLVSKPQSPAE